MCPAVGAAPVQRTALREQINAAYGLELGVFLLFFAFQSQSFRASRWVDDSFVSFSVSVWEGFGKRMRGRRERGEEDDKKKKKRWEQVDEPNRTEPLRKGNVIINPGKRERYTRSN